VFITFRAMSRLTLDLTDELRARLENASEDRHTTPERLLVHFIETLPPPANGNAGPALGERLMKWCGVDASGVADLATNPKHMEGFGAD
jgi:hypothetical protein